MKKKLLKDTFWTLGGNVITMSLTLVTTIFLAREINPEIFGKFGIIMFFISLSNVLVDSGLSGSLIRTKNKQESEYTSVFIFSLSASIIAFFMILLASKKIAIYYNTPSLQIPLIIAAIIPVISSFRIIPNVILQENLSFKKRSIILFFSSLISNLMGLFLGLYLKLGIFALLSIPITINLIQTILFTLNTKSIKNLVFNKTDLKKHLSFGINTSATSVLNLTFDNIYYLIIGKVLNITEIGYYYQAKRFQDIPNTLINTLSQSVFFSSLTKIDDTKAEFSKIFNKISKYLGKIMGLVVLTVLVFGELILTTLLGDHWAPSTIYLQLLIIGGYFYTQEVLNKIIFKIYNKTGILLKLELIKKSIQLITVLIGVSLKDITILLYGYILTNAISYYINITQIKKTEPDLNLKDNHIVTNLTLIFVFYIISKHSIFINQLDLKLLILVVFCIIEFREVVITTILKHRNVKK